MKHARTLSLAALAAVGTLSSFAMTAGPAEAAPGEYYRAELAAPLAAVRSDIQKGVLWDCAGTSCTAAAKSNSRDLIVCQRLVGEFGAITAFNAGPKAFDAAELAKCNG